MRRGGIPSQEFWNLNDKLVYWVLMPSLLFYKTSTAQYDSALVGAFSIVILSGFICATLFAIGVWKFSAMPGASSSSVMQGSIRHNTFIALAISESLFGFEGLALATIGSALLIPVTNLTVVPLMVLMNDQNRGRRIIPAVLKELSRNPLLISVAAGITLNKLHVSEVPVLHDTTRILGQAALPIMLLSVGASIRIRAMQLALLPMVLSIVGKLIIFPAATFAAAIYIGLDAMQATIAMLFASAPTASSGYTLARQMGGDAPVMAAIITIQTMISLITIPMLYLFMQSYM